MKAAFSWAEREFMNFPSRSSDTDSLSSVDLDTQPPTSEAGAAVIAPILDPFVLLILQVAAPPPQPFELPKKLQKFPSKTLPYAAPPRTIAWQPRAIDNKKAYGRRKI